MRYCVIVGTRPEAIKLAPVILKLQEFGEQVDIVQTGQHAEITESILRREFDICSNFYLGSRDDVPDLNHNISLMMQNLNGIFRDFTYDWVIVQGDTYSAMTGALTASNCRIPVAHVEAGLRTWDKYAPFPEENYRRIISSVADYHFAPTYEDGANLEREGFKNVFCVGNTVIDALRILDPKPRVFDKNTILLTLHRRENRGDHFKRTIEQLIKWIEVTDYQVIWPVHPSTDPSEFHSLNLIKTPPMSYTEFVSTLRGCNIVLTDSGGVQEEAAYLGKPTVVMRGATERPYGLLANPEGLLNILDRATDQVFTPSTKYGTGFSADYIVDHLRGAVPRK